MTNTAPPSVSDTNHQTYDEGIAEKKHVYNIHASGMDAALTALGAGINIYAHKAISANAPKSSVPLPAQ